MNQSVSVIRFRMKFTVNRQFLVFISLKFDRGRRLLGLVGQISLLPSVSCRTPNFIVILIGRLLLMSRRKP